MERFIFMSFLVLFLFCWGIQCAPVSNQILDASQSDVLNSLKEMNRPYPSESLGKDGQWDMLMVVSFDVANNNFKSMHADPNQYTMFSNFNLLDCETPVTQWWYPNGTCITISVDLQAPVIALKENSDDMFMSMTALKGWVVLSQPSGNVSQDLTGAVFTTVVSMKETTENVDGTLMYVDASKANLSVTIQDNQLSETIVLYMEEEMSDAMQKMTTPTTYPFVTFNSDSSGKDPCLVPTSFKMKQFISSASGKDLAAFFSMTQQRSTPSSTFVDESLAYLPSGSNMFLLISNSLFVKNMIPAGMSSGFKNSFITKQTSSGHNYYTLEGTFNTGQSFTAYSEYHQKEENSIVGGVETCSLKDKEVFEIILGTYSLSSLSNEPTQSFVISNLSQEYKLPYCYSSSGGEYGAYDKISTKYTSTATISVSGGMLNSISTTSGGTSYPSNNHWYNAFSDGENEAKEAEQSLKDAGDEVQNSVNTATIFGDFNIFKDEQIFFGDVKGFDLTGASILYDLIMFGNVNN